MRLDKIIKDLLKKVWWWQPITILLLIAVFGVYAGNNSGEKTDYVSEVNSEEDTLSIVESTTVYSGDEVRINEGEESVSDSESTAQSQEEEPSQSSEIVSEITIREDGNYTSKDEVALYIHTYNKLPINYITKQQAEEQGWDSSSGNLDEVLPGMSIGGSSFGNYESKLPKANGRQYFECDIDYEGGYRNSKRLVYSNDGLIFYTEDHYENFEQLY